MFSSVSKPWWQQIAFSNVAFSVHIGVANQIFPFKKHPTKCTISLLMSVTITGRSMLALTSRLLSLCQAIHFLSLLNEPKCLAVVRRRVDVQLNSTMRLIFGTLRSTPLPWLPALSNIEPPALRRKAATDKLVEKIVKHDSWPIQPDILNHHCYKPTSDIQEAAVAGLATSWHQKSMEA